MGWERRKSASIGRALCYETTVDDDFLEFMSFSQMEWAYNNNKSKLEVTVDNNTSEIVLQSRASAAGKEQKAVIYALPDNPFTLALGNKQKIQLNLQQVVGLRDLVSLELQLLDEQLPRIVRAYNHCRYGMSTATKILMDFDENAFYHLALLHDEVLF